MNDLDKVGSEKKLTKSLEKASKIILHFYNNKVIDIYKISLYNDEPKLFAYSTSYKSNDSDGVAGGFSFRKDVALIRALGETIERYCLDSYDSSETLISSSKKLEHNYLDPLRITPFSSRQLVANSFKEFRINDHSRFTWINGKSITQKKNILIPLQLIAINYKRIRNEPIIISPISTGAAAETTLKEAIYKGICEIVERDAFMISYLNKLTSPQVDLLSIHDREINEIIDTCNRYALKIVVIDLTTDLNIPTFAAILIDKTNLGPAVSIGLKAGFNLKQTVIGAIEESFLTRHWIRDKSAYNSILSNDKEANIFKSRAKFWLSTKSLKFLDFWLNNNKLKRFTDNELMPKQNLLENVIKILKEKNMDVIYVDITKPEIKKMGFKIKEVAVDWHNPARKLILIR